MVIRYPNIDPKEGSLRPTWLDLAHNRLDAAVFDAYGWPHALTDEQILERLLALNLQRAGKAAS